MLFNPFALVNRDEVIKRVKKMRATHPDLSERELCELIIVRKARLCGFSGAVTALPAVFPVVGTAVTLVVGATLDVMAVGYLMAEMVLEMSAVHGRNLTKPGVSREALWVMGSAVGADMANKTMNKAAVQGMSNQAFVRLVQEILLVMGIRTTQRTVLRIIPLLGTIISGTVNYIICRRVGGIAANYYDRNGYDKWDNTIDVEGEVLD
ncbi:MAG: hypothetical protein JL56_04625 [Desulfotomaculum sp. BICA1-6]|nr:MAG: hypothetical protein VR67_08555 [Peptococcaceae bacterium BRH_c8a]KJS76801.1 MAG: hypothetical protein JL56_04625 [Desulfotomaculum sp. BICA1-6]